MLDVHVLELGTLPEEWVVKRRQSIEEAVKLAGFQVNVWEVPGIAGHLGKAREYGYSHGEAPYVTYVDHDDYLLKNAFSVLKPHLEGGARSITTGEILLLENGITIERKLEPHHLAVFRREDINRLPYAKYKHYPDHFLMDRLADVHVPECVYVHRMWGHSRSRELRASDMLGAGEESKRIAAKELMVTEHMTFKQIAELLDQELEE